MMNRLLLIPVLLALALPAAGAGPLPASTPSGILLDRVAPLAHLEDLDGSPSAATADQARWRQAVHELRRAAEQDLAWPDGRDLQTAALAGAEAREIPLALLHARYDRLDDAGRPVPGEAFALAALRQDVYHGGAVSFRLDPARILTHGAGAIVGLTLDPDDGGGPRALILAEALPVSYGTVGRKRLVLTATLADGRQVSAAAVLDVKRLDTPSPDQVWPLTATQTYQGLAGSGLAYVYLAPGHATLTNPAVVVEGFDLDNSMDWPVLYDLLNRENLLEDLRTAGFDAVILDFTEATEPIQRNAFVLTELIDRVATDIGPDRSVALVGASMGGLVSRYALLWLESLGGGHPVRTFISFDSPQSGANIPLGLQHWLVFFQGESTDAAYLLGRLNTPAARQMLLYHHLATSGTVAAPAPLFADFRADLAALGDWPAQPRLVAVANGSGHVQGQGFAAGAQLILYEYRSLLADIDGNVWAVPDGGTQVIFDGMLDLVWPLPDSFETVTVGGTLPWDGAPGGFRASMAQMDTTPVPYGDIVALHANHCFIPTVSALALAGVGPFHDIAADGDLAGRTAFDQVYFPTANQEHIAITAENKVWLMDEVTAGVTAAFDTPVAGIGGPVLIGAVPNPFNPRTRIEYLLPATARVDLRIHDVSGRLVRTLVAGAEHRAGRHTVGWDGTNDAGGQVAAGVYFTRLVVADQVRTGRLTLLK